MSVTHRAVTDYQEEIERFFADLSAAEWMQTLPGGRSGTMLPRLWAVTRRCSGPLGLMEPPANSGRHGATDTTEWEKLCHPVSGRVQQAPSVGHLAVGLPVAEYCEWAKHY